VLGMHRIYWHSLQVAFCAPFMSVMTTTAACGWCGESNPHEASKCASCGAAFLTEERKSEALFGTHRSSEALSDTASSSSQIPWVPLRDPAKLGPLTLHANGDFTGPEHLSSHVSSSIEALKIGAATVSSSDNVVTVLTGGTERKAKYESGRWYQFHQVSSEPSAPTAVSTLVPFPGVTFTKFTSVRLDYRHPCILVARNDRSLVIFACQLIHAIRESHLPLLVSWDTENCHSNEFGLVCRKRFMGTSWTTIHIVCRALGDQFSIEIRSGLIEWKENEKELLRLRAGYWPILTKWLLYVGIYTGAVVVIHILLAQGGIRTGMTGNIIRLVACIAAHFEFSWRIDAMCARLHFPTVNLSAPNHLGVARTAFGLTSISPLFPILLLGIGVFAFVVLPDLQNILKLSNPPGDVFLFLRLVPPEVSLFLPRTLQLLWSALWGVGVARPQGYINSSGKLRDALYPNDTDSTGLLHSICNVVTRLQ
jgi:hypothetical protein